MPCLSDVLANAGYTNIHAIQIPKSRSYGAEGFIKNHHIKYGFLRQDYIDYEDFEPRGSKGFGGKIADHILFNNLPKMLPAGTLDKPFFAYFETLSTHVSYDNTIPGFEVDVERIKAAGYSDADNYTNKISAFKYSTTAIENFVEYIFNLPQGNRTLVVISSDHTLGSMPGKSISSLQSYEFGRRIFLALLTKNMPNPSINTRITHQIDIVPTITAILGIKSPQAWLGNDMFNSKETPIGVFTNDYSYWKSDDTLCINQQCYQLDGKDPLVDTTTPTVPFNAVLKAQEDFLRRTYEAAEAATARGIIPQEY